MKSYTNSRAFQGDLDTLGVNLITQKKKKANVRHNDRRRIYVGQPSAEGILHANTGGKREQLWGLGNDASAIWKTRKLEITNTTGQKSSAFSNNIDKANTGGCLIWDWAGLQLLWQRAYFQSKTLPVEAVGTEREKSQIVNIILNRKMPAMLFRLTFQINSIVLYCSIDFLVPIPLLRYQKTVK